MFLRNKKHTQKLSKKLKNKKSRKKKKKKSFSLIKRDSLNNSRNKDKISLITIKLLRNKDKNKELKNELQRIIKLIIQIIL